MNNVLLGLLLAALGSMVSYKMIYNNTNIYVLCISLLLQCTLNVYANLLRTDK